MMWNTGYKTIHLLCLQVVVFQLKLLDMYFGEHVPGNADTYEKPDVAENHAEEHTGKTWNAQYDKVDNLLSLVKSTRTIFPEIDTGDNTDLHQYSRFDDWTLDYDKNGNTTQKGTQKFYYNYRNQMVRAVEQEATTAEYKYDAMGRRIEKKVGADTTRYFYSGHQVIEERDASDAILKQFIYGNGIDELLMTAVYEDGVATPYYMHTNRIGSITAVTDENGNVVERISYEAFGKHTITDFKTDPENPGIVDNSVIGNEILFQGRRYDKETNLYYYRARSYDPVMGRFLQNDPLGYRDSMNLYQAFNQNPVNFVDPMGRQTYAPTFSEIFSFIQSNPQLAPVAIIAAKAAAVAGTGVATYTIISERIKDTYWDGGLGIDIYDRLFPTDPDLLKPIPHPFQGKTKEKYKLDIKLGPEQWKDDGIRIPAPSPKKSPNSKTGPEILGIPPIPEITPDTEKDDDEPEYVYRGGKRKASALTPRPDDDDYDDKAKKIVGGISSVTKLSDKRITPGSPYVRINLKRLKLLKWVRDPKDKKHILIRPMTEAELKKWAATKPTIKGLQIHQILKQGLLPLYCRYNGGCR